jgi:hypothetical protein
MSSLDIIKQILDKEMQMPQGRVFAYNSSVDLPQDRNLFIVLHYTAKTPYSNNIRYENTKDGKLVEHQMSNFVEDILISLMSVNQDARDRAHEVLMALRSNYAQVLQEQNKVHITTQGDIIDKSFLEATSRLNRFDVRAKIYVSYDKITNVDYYDKFPNTSKFEPEYYIES